MRGWGAEMVLGLELEREVGSANLARLVGTDRALVVL